MTIAEKKIKRKEEGVTVNF